MQTIPPRRRLSPKVRRLLREHDLDAASLPGTGAAGRLTPDDVLAAAGVRGPSSATSVLASPLARRVLRDAGIALTAAVAVSDDRRLTRAAAERAIAELGGPTGADRGTGADTPGVDAADRDIRVVESVVDVSMLLSSIGAAQHDFVRRHGFELDVVTAVARAAAGVLAMGIDGAGPTDTPGTGEDDGVRVGIVAGGRDGPGLAVVPHADDLTVAGLARRARAAEASHTPDDAAGVAITVATGDDAAAAPRPTGGTLLLACDPPSWREVREVDAFGHDVVRTRPHATLRLHHDAATSPAVADRLLEALAAAVTAWTTPVGP